MATTSSTASGTGAASGHKDRDPAPAFDGDPQMFKQFERDVALWQWESDIPKNKHAVKKLRSLRGTARAAADEVPLDKIKSEEGVTAILDKLREHYQPHLESTMPRAFERAIYGESRKAKETLQEYVIRMDKAFKELRDEGVELPGVVRGYVMYRQASLTSTQEDQVTTWTAGNFERSEVVKALRKLEKVQREKAGQKHYLMDEGDFEPSYEGMPWGQAEGDEDIENFVYIGEGDLDQVFDEEELHEALATYQQVRKALRDQRTERGWAPQSKGNGKINFGSQGIGGFRFGKGSRVHIESLKLRTRCAKCGSIGHWARECTNPPDQHARNRAAAGGHAKGGGSSMSGKSGFVHIENHMGNNFMIMQNIEDPWKFPTLGMFLKKGKVETISSSSPFCGIFTDAERGVVDTAAQSGLIGQKALERLQRSLASHGLRVRNTNRKGQARGVGGQAVATGVVELPIGIAGVNGILEATVIQDDVPLLLPVSLLRDLHAQVDLFENKLILSKFDKRTDMSVMPSGHVTVNIMEFDEAGWKVPIEAREHGITEEQFQLFLCGNSAPVVEPIDHSIRTSSSVTYHVAMGSSPADQPIYGRVCQPSDRRAGVLSSPSVSTVEEAAESGASHDPTLPPSSQRRSRGPARSGSLARRWLVLWMCAAVCGGCESATVDEYARAFQQTRELQRADQEWHQAGSAQVKQPANDASGNMCASSRELSRCWEPTSARSVLQVVSQPMEGGDDAQLCGTQEGGIQVVSAERYVPMSNDATKERIVVDEPYVSCNSDSSSRCNGDHLPLPEAGQEIHSEEGGAHSRKAFLPLQHACMRVLPMGSPGGSEVGRGDEEGSRSESRGGQTQGGAGTSSEDGRGEGSSIHGKRGHDLKRTAHEGGSADGSSKSDGHASSGLGGNHADPCQCEVRRDDGEPATSAPSTSGATAESVGMDDRRDRRGESECSDEQLGDACRVSSKGVGIATEHGPAEPAHVGGRLVRQRDFTNEEMEQNLQHAPWAYELLVGRQDAHTLRSAQLEESYEPIGDRRVKEAWWAKRQEEDAWRFHQGIFPTENSLQDGMRMIAWVTPEAGLEDEEVDRVYGTLCRSSRKRLRKALDKVVVSELYSEPRIAKEAQQQGMQAGTSIDLKTGFDLTKAGDRQRAWRKLKEEDPDLVMICPPCGPFSQMQAINYITTARLKSTKQ